MYFLMPIVITVFLLSLQPTFALERNPVHDDPLSTWQNTFPVLYYLDSNTVPDDLVDVITDAFDRFNDAIEFVLYQQTYERNDSKIIVYFGNIDGKGDTLASARWNTTDNIHEMKNATIKFDSSEKWVNSTNTWKNRDNGTISDMESVAVHEVGHLSGLDHSENRAHVMYYKNMFGETFRRQLTDADIDAFKSVYSNLLEKYKN